MNFNDFKGAQPGDFDESFQTTKKKFARKYLLNVTMDDLLIKVE